MRFFTSFIFTAGAASAAVISTRQNGNGGLQKGAQTLVLKEVGGIPGNECLTFRNNGTASHFFGNLESTDPVL